MKPPARVAEIPALTGLRALLAWWVVVYHMTIPELAPLPPDGWLEPLRAHGYLAVDGFFVLSGFILSYVYRDAFAAGVPGIYPRFLLARLARLYPVHLAMTLVVLAMLGAAVVATGFQPRVADRFSRAAKGFASAITVTHGDAKADGKMIWDLMMLVVLPDAEVTVEVDGSDAATALETLADILASPGGEDYTI
mgnify:CR=1 FL=1